MILGHPEAEVTLPAQNRINLRNILILLHTHNFDFFITSASTIFERMCAEVYAASKDQQQRLKMQLIMSDWLRYQHPDVIAATHSYLPTSLECFYGVSHLITIGLPKQHIDQHITAQFQISPGDLCDSGAAFLTQLDHWLGLPCPLNNLSTIYRNFNATCGDRR